MTYSISSTVDLTRCTVSLPGPQCHFILLLSSNIKQSYYHTLVDINITTIHYYLHIIILAKQHHIVDRQCIFVSKQIVSQLFVCFLTHAMYENTRKYFKYKTSQLKKLVLSS